ncbi:MAG: hypothetical protein R3272_07850 [Candidatus Promineifilaceae bacterium]|nr:hypothetical protein [Candidatus Promineifilaceae bacterium]
MTILRDEARIARLRRLGAYASLIGFLALVFALVAGFLDERFFYLQIVLLPVGWLISQIGLYMSHRYMREPRPDEVLDEALGRVARNGRMYHYLLPASHVLLMPAGPIVFVTKYQGGDISVEGDRWKQKGVSLFRKLLSQEALGNPTREAEQAVRSLASYISKHAPEVEEVPIGAIIVFTSKTGADLDLEGSTIPAMHYTKLRGYFKRKAPREPLPEEDYRALRAAFDKAAARVIEQEKVTVA